ncbi:MAG: alpha/beta hydrolase [Bacteroidetes bacterium]|nr:alpha/beta hydrolase [Bacteroidota bacterium]
MKHLKIITLLITVVFIQVHSFSQVTYSKKMQNVVYGMVSGTALLMDIYMPITSNHKAILFIPGSAWGFPYSLDYDQTPLKEDVLLDSNYTGKWVHSLVQNGYTVCVINHRFSPRYHYNEIIEDCRRAVRYVRYNANELDIDPDHIGAMGHSSGANLASMLGVSDDNQSYTHSSVDSVSAKVQAVVTLAAPFNLADINRSGDTAIVNDYILSAISAYMGSLPEMKAGVFILSGKYKEASPFAQVTKDDAPTLIYNSDNDPLIPIRQANDMYHQLIENNVPTQMIISQHTGHNPIPDMRIVCKWFDKYLH